MLLPLLFTGEFVVVVAAVAIPLLLDGIAARLVIHISCSGSYASFTDTFSEESDILPPITNIFPSITAEPAWCLAVGINALDVQVLLDGSYASFEFRGLSEEPPIAYNDPLIKLTFNAPLAVGIGFPSCHLF